MKLEEEQIEGVIRAAECAARRYIISRLSKREVEDLEITVEVEIDGDLTFDVEVYLDTVSNDETYQELVDGATEAAHAVIKDELDRLIKH